MPKKDINQIANNLLKAVCEESTPPVDLNGKNPAAVALGKLGGAKGGNARAQALTKKQRSQIAQIAAAARWKKI